MARGDHTLAGFAWDAIPLGLPLTPSNILYGLAILIIVATYLRMRRLRLYGKGRPGGASGATGFRNVKILRADAEELIRDVRSAWTDGNLSRLERRLDRNLFNLWSASLAASRGSAQAPSGRAQPSSAASARVILIEILTAEAVAGVSDGKFVARVTFAMQKAPETSGLATGMPERFSEEWKLIRFPDGWKLREVRRDGVPAMPLVLTGGEAEGNGDAG